MRTINMSRKVQSMIRRGLQARKPRFEGANADDVRRACEEAGISFARIVETHDFPPAKEEQ
jgi:hypothetical protein